MVNRTTRSLSPAPSRGRRQDPSDRQGGRGRSPAPEGRGRSHSPNPVKSIPPAPIKIKGPPNLMDHGYGSLPLALIPEHDDDDDFWKAVQRCIPSEFVLIASQDDVSKAQEDHYAMDHFKLTPPDGRNRWLNSEMAGSVATCALLQLLYENPQALVANTADDSITPWNMLEILQEIQTRIKTCTGMDANPTSSSSRPMGPPRFDEGTYAPYYIVPPQHTQGTRRALLIGIVSGGDNALKGTLNDVYNIRRFLVDHCGFLEDNIVTLVEKPGQQQPTKKNITDGFAKLIRESKKGDVNFIQFSGHGSRSDTNLYIIPCDFQQNGYIMDDKILKNLIKAMPDGVYTTMLVDCCYSGTVCDLPYILKPTSTEQEIEKHFRTSIKVVKHKPQTAPPSTRRRMTRQSVQSFYNLDTLSETLEKEAKGGEEYQQKEKARKQKQAWMHFEPKKLVAWDSNVHNAKTMASKTKKGFFRGLGAVGQAAHDAAELAIEATAHASDKVIDVTKKTTAKISGKGMDESSGTTTRERKRSKSPIPSRTDDDIQKPNVKDRSRPRSLAPVSRRKDEDAATPGPKNRARPRSLAPAPRRRDGGIPTPSARGRTRPRSKAPTSRRSNDNKPTPSDENIARPRSKSPLKAPDGKNVGGCQVSESAAPTNSNLKPQSNSPDQTTKKPPSVTAAPIDKPAAETPISKKKKVVKSTSKADDTVKPPAGTKMPSSVKAGIESLDKENEEALQREFEEAANTAAKEMGQATANANNAPKNEIPEYDWKNHPKKAGHGRTRGKSPRATKSHSTSKARSKSPTRRS